MTTVALTIAGSDPSGGAGIQADLRTFAALGVVGISVITALTVQNSLGVQSVHPVPADVLAAQLDAILSDTRVQAVKIGMLGGADQVRTVAAALRKYAPPNIVLDPVLASTGGVPLLDEEGRAALLTELMPLCDLVTPNVPELGVLTGMATKYGGERAEAAGHLQSLGVKTVLVKGGHLPNCVADRLFHPGNRSEAFTGPRVETAHTHGTGCLLSSAVAAILASGQTLEEAVATAKRLVARSLLFPVCTGKGRGYPDIQQGVLQANDIRRSHSALVSAVKGVYVVTDPVLRPGRKLSDIVSAALVGGAHTIQLRAKGLSDTHLASIARSAWLLAREKEAVFIVNDRVEVARDLSDGVHLGPDDMTPAGARRLMRPNQLVGVSVATVEEARAAAPYASYFGVGAIFGSKTKLDAGEPIGVGRIREIKAAFPDIPVVAIGGINADNIAEVARAGADAAAVVSAVVAAPDMEAATRELVARFEAGKA